VTLTNFGNLGLFGATGDQKIRYVAVPSGSAANPPEPSATSPEFSDAITISSSTLIRAAVFSADGTAHGPIASAYYAKLNASLGNFTSQLPVMIIDSLGAGPQAVDDHHG